MNEFKIIGKQHIAGYEFTGIEGGFGPGKRSMLVKEIAAIHGKKIGHVNELINKNRKRFSDGADIVDLKDDRFAIVLADSGLFTQNAINAAKNIYVLSERGYAKLLKILEDDKAWELYDKLVDDYFSLRAESKKPKTNAEMFMMAAEQLLSQEKRINRLESNLAAAHSRIDNLDKIDTIGDLQQRLNKMVRLYAQHDGLTYQQAWRNFRQSFNTAYRENLTLRIENYKMNHHIKALSMPQYLSKVGRLDDAIRVADKLLNQRSEVI